MLLSMLAASAAAAAQSSASASVAPKLYETIVTTSPVDTSPPPHLIISPSCNASIQSSNYNPASAKERKKASIQLLQDWEFTAWRTFTGYLRPILPAATPRTIVDVGCGFALYDIFVHRHYKHAPKIIYFDQAGAKTSTRRKDNAFKKTGGWHPLGGTRKMPFYHHDRSCTAQIAIDNGVPEANVELLNATAANLAALSGSVDLIYSHMSWGFHYPVATYATSAFAALRPGGTLLLTVIERFANRFDGIYKDPTTKRWRKVTSDNEIRDAMSAGFQCTVIDNGYRKERLKVVTCAKPKPGGGAGASGTEEFATRKEARRAVRSSAS